MTTPINLPDEADIGSGEKSPGHRDTEKLIEQVGDSPAQKAPADKPPENKAAGTAVAKDGSSIDSRR
jgi:hypothetical protein